MNPSAEVSPLPLMMSNLIILFCSDTVLEDEKIFEVVSELDNELGMFTMMRFIVVCEVQQELGWWFHVHC